MTRPEDRLPPNIVAAIALDDALEQTPGMTPELRQRMQASLVQLHEMLEEALAYRARHGYHAARSIMSSLERLLLVRPVGPCTQALLMATYFCWQTVVADRVEPEAAGRE